MSQESIARLVEEQHPSAMVLTEETDSLMYCEQHRMDAMHYNTRAVRFFTEAAQKTGARVVYRSSAYVFDGRKPGGLYTETDHVNPINVYGETKLMGEVHTDKVHNFLIVRLGELYGAYEGTSPITFAGNWGREKRSRWPRTCTIHRSLSTTQSPPSRN
jgi:dTDP-4-dehydrorhamnose reductase